MISITLKAKHFYYILNFIKNSPMFQFISVVTRMKAVLGNNTNDEAEFTISVSVVEIAEVYRILTQIPEGIGNMINVEMDQMLQPQIAAGITDEITNSVPQEQAYWQQLAFLIQEIKTTNFQTRDNAIIVGKSILASI